MFKVWQTNLYGYVDITISYDSIILTGEERRGLEMITDWWPDKWEGGASIKDIKMIRIMMWPEMSRPQYWDFIGSLSLVCLCLRDESQSQRPNNLVIYTIQFAELVLQQYNKDYKLHNIYVWTRQSILNSGCNVADIFYLLWIIICPLLRLNTSPISMQENTKY